MSDFTDRVRHEIEMDESLVIMGCATARIDERAMALAEFEAAAREAKRTQELAQAAARRYADAVKRLSEACTAEPVAG